MTKFNGKATKAKIQLNFTEYAAECIDTGTVYRRTTTELYDLYSHPEDMRLYIQIMGDGSEGQPNLFIEDVTPKTLRYALAQLQPAALDNCMVWLRAYDGAPLREFAFPCITQYEDFGVLGRSFRLCEFAEGNDSTSIPMDDILIIHEEEIAEKFYKLMNIINNDNK